MSLYKWILLIGLILHTTPLGASTEPADNVLRVYGPGGPHHVLAECASLFHQKTGQAVTVIKALPHDLAEKLPANGDIYYGGAQYMLEDFNRKNPGVLDMSTADKLHPRRIGIIVRQGNPLNIRGTGCLTRDEVHLLDVKLERMRHFYNNPDNPLQNVRQFEYTGQRGFSTWRESSELDAWVTYRSWHKQLTDGDDFIEIPGDHALRYTPVALTHRTPYRPEAQAFIEFLKSAEAREIFIEHGWD